MKLWLKEKMENMRDLLIRKLKEEKRKQVSDNIVMIKYEDH
jgi:hypothetical protein|tara:strand:- start:178 stop:300 length:123 start_codon:yes stop_codon:yes gene_type:complete